ncbi:MAG: 4Fe-4S dicluster domain-containing protein [Chloroflexota bacterium]
MGDRISRRDFIRSTVVAGTLLATGQGVAAAKHAGSDTPKTKYAMVIDTTKCTGCGACVDACNLRNNLPQGVSYVRIYAKGEGEEQWFMPVQCQHCADAPCETVCPTHATYHTVDGVVLINEKLCVGCRYCEVACPYQARRFDHDRGVADKCWLCMDYVLGGGEPACVHSCILGARIFGRLDDPDSEVSKLIASGVAKPLHPEFGTEPAVLHYIIG